MAIKNSPHTAEYVTTLYNLRTKEKLIEKITDCLIVYINSKIDENINKDNFNFTIGITCLGAFDYVIKEYADIAGCLANYCGSNASLQSIARTKLFVSVFHELKKLYYESGFDTKLYGDDWDSKLTIEFSI